MMFYILHFLCFAVIRILLLKRKMFVLFFQLWEKEKTYWLSSPFPINNNKIFLTNIDD